MAVLAPILALLSRFAGKVLTTTLGWATTLLFGRVPASRQVLLSAIAFGSVLWLVLLLGIAFPDLGTFLVALVPGQDLVSDDLIRLAMLAGAVIVPGIVGATTTLLVGPAERRPRRIAAGVARGYPLTSLLALLLIFLAGLAVFRKARSFMRRWTDAHVPLVVRPGRYEEVARDLGGALTAAGIHVGQDRAPASMTLPARWLAAVAGGGGEGLVPERLVRLRTDGLDILVYPMDVLMSGTPSLVTRARAAIATRLATSAAYLTISAEAQSIEDRLASLARDHVVVDEAAAAAFATIDGELAVIEIPYEEWEVLYRERLQVERDLRAAGDARAAPLDALEDVGRVIRAGADGVLDVAADDRARDLVERVAGPEWRWGARLASLLLLVLRPFLGAREVDRGEPVSRAERLEPGGEVTERGRALDDPVAR